MLQPGPFVAQKRRPIRLFVFDVNRRILNYSNLSEFDLTSDKCPLCYIMTSHTATVPEKFVQRAF